MRRASGDGSIYRRKDGRWAASISLGGRRRRTVYGGTREEVRRQLSRLLKEVDNGTYADARGLRLGEFLQQWLEESVKPRVRTWTYVGYEVNVRLHITPSLGRIRLDELTPLDVQRWMNRKLADGLAPKSVRHLRATLRAALNQAIRWGMLSRNAAMLVEPPRVRRYEIRP